MGSYWLQRAVSVVTIDAAADLTQLQSHIDRAFSEWNLAEAAGCITELADYIRPDPASDEFMTDAERAEWTERVTAYESQLDESIYIQRQREKGYF